MQRATVSLAGGEHELSRFRLGKYLEFREADQRLDEAVELGDNGKIADGLYDCIKVAIPLTREAFEASLWTEIAIAYEAVASLAALPRPERFAIISGLGQGHKPDPWDYPGRTRFTFINLLARAYGWTIQQIEDLWPDEAFGLIQEIVAADQYEREFAHSLSEIAYPYDQATRRSIYRPLMRPAWMVIGRRGRPTVTKLLKKSLPVGLIVGLDGTHAGGVEPIPDEHSGGD